MYSITKSILVFSGVWVFCLFVYLVLVLCFFWVVCNTWQCSRIIPGSSFTLSLKRLICDVAVKFRSAENNPLYYITLNLVRICFKRHILEAIGQIKHLYFTNQTIQIPRSQAAWSNTEVVHVKIGTLYLSLSSPNHSTPTYKYTLIPNPKSSGLFFGVLQFLSC